MTQLRTKAQRKITHMKHINLKQFEMLNLWSRQEDGLNLDIEQLDTLYSLRKMFSDAELERFRESVVK